MSNDPRIESDSAEVSSKTAMTGGDEAGSAQVASVPDQDAEEGSELVPSNPSGSKAAGRRGKVVVLAVTLAVLTAAGFSIAKSLREADWLQAAASQLGALATGKDKAPEAGGGSAEPAGSVITASEDPSERCELQVFSGDAGGESIVVLTSPGKMSEARQSYVGDHSRLVRELARQALLMTAREELNLVVRDAAIGDPLPKGVPTIVIDVAVPCSRDKVAIRLSRRVGPNHEVLFEGALRENGAFADYLTPARKAEKLSRGGMLEALKKAGVKGKARSKPGAGALPDGVEERLLKMSFVSQFAAIRQLHEAIRADGLSPRRIHALTRGYANLGALTDFQWDAAPQAYKARALLYAQRDVNARPGAPVARWNRAYASALAGVHVLALHDLKEATQFAGNMAEAERPTPPPWVDLIDAYCQYNVKRFVEPRTDKLASLEAFLYLLTVERPAHSDVTLNAARGAIDVEPGCFRAFDALCEVGGIANLHQATTVAPEVLDTFIPRQIATLPGLPEAVKETAKEGRNEVRMTNALDEAAAAARDAVEPSWGALAKIVRETRFVHTYRRIEFMARRWSVPTGGYWHEIRPLVANHRFRPYLETFVRGPIFDKEYLLWVKDLDTTDLGINAWSMALDLPKMQVGGVEKGYYMTAAALSDWAVRDLSVGLSLQSPQYSAEYARKLLSVSPNSAYAMGVLVEHAWDEAEKKVEGWRATVGDHPSLIGPLARQYNRLGRMEEAEALLKRYIELSPDPWAYQLLANRAKALGDEKRWKEILDKYLASSEDHGLDHAKIRVEIANTLMAKGCYDEARPYAEAAAATWAGWAMSVAQRCAEGQEDWEGAEKWAQARGERYPNTSAYDWIEFCERTGHGDWDAARDGTFEYLDRFDATNRGIEVALPHALLLMMRDEPAKTFEPLQALLKAEDEEPAGHQSVFVTLLAAAGQAGDRKLLDSTAEQFVKKYADASPRFSGILSKLREAIAKDDPDSLDRKGIDTLIKETQATIRGGPALVVAAYLAGCDRPDLAKPYWEQAAEKSQAYFWWRLVAADKLRRQSR